MKIQKFPVLIISVLTLVLLGFGIFYPMITLSLDAHLDAGLVKFDNKVIDSTRSILGTTKELFDNDRYLVASLIFLFSVIIPLLKSVLFAVSFYAKDTLKLKIQKILEVIGKWSMADVFVVAIFLAYLATADHVENSEKLVQVFGMKLNIKFHAVMTTTLEPGFYFFLSYCLISLASTQIFKASLNSPKE